VRFLVTPRALSGAGESPRGARSDPAGLQARPVPTHDDELHGRFPRDLDTDLGEGGEAEFRPRTTLASAETSWRLPQGRSCCVVPKRREDEGSWPAPTGRSGSEHPSHFSGMTVPLMEPRYGGGRHGYRRTPWGGGPQSNGLLISRSASLVSSSRARPADVRAGPSLNGGFRLDGKKPGRNACLWGRRKNMSHEAHALFRPVVATVLRPWAAKRKNRSRAHATVSVCRVDRERFPSWTREERPGPGFHDAPIVPAAPCPRAAPRRG